MKRFFVLAMMLVMGFGVRGAMAQQTTVSAVMLSDIHLDPFHDPGKVAELVKTPVEGWAAILGGAASTDQAEAFAAVQKACKAKDASDSSYALMTSGLKAAKAQAPETKFVTVSGDLLVHDLDCRYRASLHMEKAKGDDQSLSAAFAEKLMVFVVKQVEAAFPGATVYVALGNNDSRCNHNRIDVTDAFLTASSAAVLEGLVGVKQTERERAAVTYERAGYYAVTMAAPMEHTRLLVVDDVYMMSKFANCEAEETDHAGADEQIAWLNKELDNARAERMNVWVMGHLPPVVNPKSTLAKGNICASGAAETFLTKDDLAKSLIAYGDVVKLGIFGHTHMDELHLLGEGAMTIPVKGVPSISPVDGNIPSFTVAQVSAISSGLRDFTVYEASNTTGAGTTWAKEYSFDEAYKEPDFSSVSLTQLVGRFRADAAGSSAETQSFETHVFKGAPAWVLNSVWPGYVCAMDHATAESFKSCVCGTAK